MKSNYSGWTHILCFIEKKKSYERKVIMWGKYAVPHEWCCFFQSLGALSIVFLHPNSSFCLSWTWDMTEGNAKSLCRFWGLVLKIHNNQHNSKLPVNQRRKPKELKCTELKPYGLYAAKQMLWPICCAFLVAQHIWHGLPCTMWNGLSCPAWEWTSCSVVRKSSITMPRDAECVYHVGQHKQEGKWVRPLPSREICCGPNTDSSFYLLLLH